jgi:ubiquinone/menaquinone biosynthesis C-methylase UbiE
MPNPTSLSNASSSPLTTRIFAAFYRLFFNLLYHQFAWTYDAVAWVVSLGAWQKWVLSVELYLVGPRTLEIGFGPGHLQAALNQKGMIAFGLDESHQMGRIARRRLTRLGVQPKLVRGDALALPFAEQRFHQVVMTFPSEYILNRASLEEIYRVLVDDGVAIVLPLAWITGQKPLERAAAWFTRVTGEAPEWHEESLEPLKNAGFKVEWEMIDLSSSKILVIRMAKLLPIDNGLQSSS